MISCEGQEFLVTVDMAGQVRMLYLKDLERDPFKYSNIITSTGDNSTWSVDGSLQNPPRIAVGSNTHKVTVYNLQTGNKHTINAHHHNVPCVSFSPCGRFIASTSIDKTLKVWEERGSANKCVKVCMPSADWGWAVQWIDKTKCDIQIIRGDKATRNAGGVHNQTDQTIRNII